MGVDSETQDRHYPKDGKPNIIDAFDARGRGAVNTAPKVGQIYGEIIGLLEERLRVKTFPGSVTTSNTRERLLSSYECEYLGGHFVKVIHLQVGPGHLVNASLRSKVIFIRSFHRKDQQRKYQTISLQ